MDVLTEVNSWMCGLLVVRGGGDSGRLASAAAPLLRAHSNEESSAWGTA